MQIGRSPLKRKLMILCMFILAITAHTQEKETDYVDLDKLKPEQIQVGKSVDPNEDLDAREKFHEKLKAILKKSKRTGVIFKDKSNRIFTNGEYKFQLKPENPSELFSHIEYRIDSSVFKVYDEPVPLEEEGFYKLAYRGVDKLNNLEELRSYTIRVDRTPPEITIDLVGEEFKGQDGNLYFKPGVKLEVRGYDKSSGLNMIILNINGKGNLPLEDSETTFTTGGEYDIAARGLDNVYNLSKKVKVNFWIDNIKPSASMKITPEVKVINERKFCKVDSLITLSAKDGESGISKIEYSFDKTKWSDFGNPIPVPRVNDFKLYYRATDNTGNVSDPVEFSCLVDYIPPRTNIKVYER